MGYEHDQQKGILVSRFGNATTKGFAMSVAAKRKPAKGQGSSASESEFDRELEDLPQDLRWREWMGRIEAVLFASSSPVDRDDLARVVGKGASVDVLIADIQAELTGRPYELAVDRDGRALRHRLSPADRPGGAEGHLWQRCEPRFAGAAAAQGSDCERSTFAEAWRAAYLCDDGNVSDDV